MKNNKKIESLIINSLKELNEELPEDKQIELTSDAVLFGVGGQLDSLGLVNLLVIIEQNIEDNYGVSVTIADEKAMSQKHSPFKTVSSLNNFIELLLSNIEL